MRTLKYGGDLHPGDFIAVSNGNCINFGWYAGDGRGTLQYYDVWGVKRSKQCYDSHVADFKNGKETSKYFNSLYEKGFTIKCLWKAYINAVHDSRVLKITHPEELFTNKEDRDTYEIAKEALITINFIKK